MIKKAIIIFFLITSLFGFSQHEEIINKENIGQLTKIVDSINDDFQKLKEYPKFNSLEQTTANYLQVKTLKGEEFESKLNANYPFEKLLEEYGYSVLDRDLLVTKNINPHYSKKGKELTIQSYEINQNGKHSLRVKYDSLMHDDSTRKYIYKKYYSSKTKISSFYIWYLHQPFKFYELPAYINKQITYADAIIGKEQVFTKRDCLKIYSSTSFKFNKLYDSITKKPAYDKSMRYFDFTQKMYRWKKTKDSLFHENYLKNESTRIETDSIISHIIKSEVSNDELHNFVIKYGSKEKGLFLKRNYPDITPNCLGNSLIPNLRDIAYLSSDIPNWSVYIQAHLGMLNWSISQNWDNNNFKIREDRTTKELTKLPILLNDLLLGISYKIDNPTANHYKGCNNHLTKTYAFSINKEKTIGFYHKILNDSNVDPFNKLLFYNMFKKVVTNTDNDTEKIILQKKLDTHVENLPSSIKDRIRNRNLEFENLLGSQKQLFLEHFIIPSRSISFYSSSGTWNGTFKLKNEELPISLYIYDKIGNSFTDIQQLVNTKDEYVRRVKSNVLLHQYIKENNHITIKLEEGKSYTEERYSKYIPESILKKYDKMFDTAISLYSKHNGNSVRWLLFSNGDLLLVDAFKGFRLGKYTEEELISLTYEIRGEKYRKAYKIFNKEGELIN